MASPWRPTSYLAAFIIWKHRANVQRLLAGTENRFGRRAAGSAPRA